MAGQIRGKFVILPNITQPTFSFLPRVPIHNEILTKGGDVRPPVSFSKRAGWLLAVGLALVLIGAGAAWGQQTLKVTQANQSLYPEADFASTPLASVPVGATVRVLRQAGDWYQVDYAGTTGWMHRQAFPSAQAPSRFGGLPGLLFGGPVKETTSDEVALAGKGFTPEVEASYRQKHPELNFAQVDKVEAFRVNDAQLQAFIKEGGLKP